MLFFFPSAKEVFKNLRSVISDSNIIDEALQVPTKEVT